MIGGMDYILPLLLNNQWYVGYLFLIMVASAFVQKNGFIYPILDFIYKYLPFKRFFVIIVSLITGILPIPGRVSISAGILSILAKDDNKSRENFGIIDYLSTHHYYLWSPLEKSVIVPMAVLGISYAEYINNMWPLVIVGCVIPFLLIFFLIDEDSIHINTVRRKENVKWFDLKVLISIACIIILGNYLKLHTDFFQNYVKTFSNSLYIACGLGFVSSFLLGSSSRFSAITAILTKMFGIKYLPLFFAIDYSGYMLSPIHKCVMIGKGYFKTPLLKYYKYILLVCISILLVALIKIGV